jgi:hypothetical protein
VRKTPFLHPFVYEKRSTCHDRLGTNIEKTPKMDAFFAGTHVRELKPDADFLAGSLSGVVAWTHRVKGPDQHVVLADMEKVRKHIFWDAVCILKVIILPRQARDNHREEWKQKAFCAGHELAQLQHHY